MKKLFLLICPLLVSAVLLAQQNPPSGVVKVNPLTDTVDQLQKIIYQYPSFKEGYAVLTNGSTVASRFNYNLLLRELLFIQTNGDTLSLSNPERYRYIVIDHDTVYFTPKGAFWLVQRPGDVILLKRNSLLNVGSEKKGAYGGYSSGASITTVSTLTNKDNVVTKLSVDENTFYAFESSYYLMDRFGVVAPATKKSFYDVFAKKEKVLHLYLQEHAVDFHKEKDLVELLRFLETQ